MAIDPKLQTYKDTKPATQADFQQILAQNPQADAFELNCPCGVVGNLRVVYHQDGVLRVNCGKCGTQVVVLEVAAGLRLVN